MGIEQGSTNRWKTARERNRLKARYIIHSRVISHVSSSSNNNNNEDDNNNCQTICTSSSSSTKSSVNEKEKELKIILQYMQSVIQNDVSSFSVVALVRDGQLLNGPLPSLLHSYHDTANLHSQFQLKNELSNMLSTSTMSLTTYRTTKDDNNQELLLQPVTLAASKFGTEYVAQRLVPYMEYLKNMSGRQLTLIEYASLLGRHSIVSLLLLGGLDPTITSFNNNNGKARSCKVLSRFHCLNGEEVIPLTIWSYIVRAIIEMRINGALLLQYDQKVGQDSETTTSSSSSTMLCTLCNNNEVRHLLHFGPPCHHHTYCEPCMWEHLIDGLSNNCTQLQRNVVTCPICEAEFDGFQYCQQQQQHCHSSRRRTKETEDKSCEQISNDDEKKDDKTAVLPPMNELSIQNSGNDHEGTKMMQGITIQTIEQRKQRRLKSLDKFMKLPATSTALKSKKKKKNNKQKKRDAAHGTWEEALRQRVQTNQSKEVRVDRFFRAILSSPHLVASYLEAGIDVNIKNVYGQTPLYIACWKGKLMTVQLLLDYDADPTVAANGGSTCYSVAKKFARIDVLELLERYCAVDDHAINKVGIDIPTNLVMTGNDYNYQVSTLIDPTLDHPGAGACIIDNALTEAQLQYLDSLWQSLPVADVCDDGDDDEVERDVASIKGVQSLNSASDGSNGKSENYEHYRPSRSYFCDSEEVVQNMLAECVQAARLSTLPSSSKESNDIASTTINNTSPPSSVLKHLRFLNYERPGGILPPHVDLCRIDDESGYRSTHTFILYLTDCEHGGGTALLQCLKHPEVISIAKPRRGRALIFPHLCPHSGLETVSPKLLLRGEVII